MKIPNMKIRTEDIQALDKVLQLVKDFVDKNPIKKYTINYDRIKEKIEQLKNSKLEDLESNYDLFNDLLKKLKSIVSREFHPAIYFLIGGHGGVIINDSGFCEFDDPRYALIRLLERMKLAIESKAPYNLEVAICCLEWLKKNCPDDFLKFTELFHEGRFEIINPSYAQPYNLIIGTESNIKQFEFGLKILKELDLECKMYYCSECSLHPQIPQLMKSFNIPLASLRTRLLGTCPTSNSGLIDWVGLDGTKISSLIDQPSVFNGEYWHGTFFREIPNLLFQSIARPFMNHIIYSSIEDFIMPQSYQEEVWRASGFLDIFGKFVTCSELFHLIEKNGEFKYNRDEFSLGNYIFIPTELFLNNKNCESCIISAEIINCILGLFNENSADSFLDELWKNLLLTQAHDNYAVPFTQTGDYSANQLSAEEFSKLKLNIKKISISQLSLNIQKEIQNKCINYINEGLSKLVEFLEKKPQNSAEKIANLFIFNPSLFSRRDIVSIQMKLDDPSNMILIGDKETDFQYQNSILKFIPEVPPLGYKIYSLIKGPHKISKKGDFFYKVNISDDLKAIEIKFQDKKIYELKFHSNFEYKLSIENHSKDNIEEIYFIIGEIPHKKFKIEITQYLNVNRLEFNLNSISIREIILIPAIDVQQSFINYPFGIEETKRSEIQTLDFLWLKSEKEGILFVQKNSQRFIINRENFEIRNLINSNAEFKFAIVKTEGNELNSLINHINSFNFKLMGVKINKNYEFSQSSVSYLTIDPSISFINLWRRDNNFYLRILNSSNERQNLKLNGALMKNQLKEIDLNYKEIKMIKDNQIIIDPWKILTLIL